LRVVLGLSYNGSSYEGWQSQLSGNTIQDRLEHALGQFTAQQFRVNCAGRTDAGVHGLMQVVHFDTPLDRDEASWVRGTNAFLPRDIAIQWARHMPDDFHSRGSALARRYAYVLLESPVRPSVEAGRVGWVYRPMDSAALSAPLLTWWASMIFLLSGRRSARPKAPSRRSRASRCRGAGLTGALSSRPMPFCTT